MLTISTLNVFIFATVFDISVVSKTRTLTFYNFNCVSTEASVKDPLKNRKFYGDSMMIVQGPGGKTADPANRHLDHFIGHKTSLGHFPWWISADVNDFDLCEGRARTFFFSIHSDWSLYDLQHSIERFFLTSTALPCV